MFRLCKSLGKIIFYKNKINAVLEAELELKIKNIKYQAAEIVCFL